MATHSSIIAWKIPWTEEPEELDRLRPWGRRVGHNWAQMHKYTLRLFVSGLFISKWLVLPFVWGVSQWQYLKSQNKQIP